jgi:trigger factor
MKYTRENLPKSQVKFIYTVEGEEWKAAIKKAYEKTKHNYAIEGFRKGKVPQKMIESKYGTGVFFEDALDILLPDAYSYALDKEPDVYPVARPDIDLISISDNEVKFAIIITVKPEIKLGSYKGHEIPKIVNTATDEEVESKVNQAREQAGSWEEVTDRAVINGDTIDLDYSGSVDGVKFEGGTAEKQTLVIGSGAFIPGFEEQLIGMNIGEEKDITVTFPAEYGAKELAGKAAVFKVKINAIKYKALPELDDEFAKDVSEFDTLVDYKADVKKQLQAEKDEAADGEMSNALVDKIIEGSEIEVPEPMIESQIDDMIQEFSQRLSYQGMKIEDYYKYTGLKPEDMRGQYRDVAIKNIKVRLVLDAIVKAEKITASAEELEDKMKKMAEDMKKDYEEYKKGINEEYTEYFKSMIVSDKLLAFLKENNTFKAE